MAITLRSYPSYVDYNGKPIPFLRPGETLTFNVNQPARTYPIPGKDTKVIRIIYSSGRNNWLRVTPNNSPGLTPPNHVVPINSDPVTVNDGGAFTENEVGTLVRGRRVTYMDVEGHTHISFGASTGAGAVVSVTSME